MSHEAADFQRRKAIEVRADVDRLPLDLRVQRRRVFGRLDHLGNRGKDEAGRVLKILRLELPDAIHDDVGRTEGSPDQPAGAVVALNLDPLSHIADEDAVQRAVESAEAGIARGLPECGFEQVSVQPGLIAGVQYAAYRTAGLEQRCRIGIRGLQPGEERLAVKRVLAQNLTENGQHGFLTLAVSDVWPGRRQGRRTSHLARPFQRREACPAGPPPAR